MSLIDEIETKGKNTNWAIQPGANEIIKKVMSFLGLFMCETLIKRILSLALIAVGVPNNQITELTGLCDRSIRSLKKAVEKDEMESIFTVGGGGRKSKLINVERSIIDEIQNNNYHSRQQIADMIEEKYSIKISLPAIGRLLKKTASDA